MHSGEPCLILEDGIDYDSFPEAADAWASRLQFAVRDKVDGPDVRLWICEREGKRYRLAFDDWFPELSLEPCDAEAAVEIPRIGAAIGAVQPGATER
ncbi:MAG TPA: DUF3630 family protein [Verrucomicrobiales bacterium]|nr:DUF3630 family protein [Verrucomicrobiales bacterium]